ncbi:hypothetical protein BVC80_989g8 [Macleaya cordata]|uniref:RNase H type-1 domain-containing protein n=1 Tax=Macleaya cordata TaxID=56857 RepID=A0A200PRZ5_MACCD|nr:hypothetical protein BVC80_989g8 [Macleaya cordata]
MAILSRWFPRFLSRGLLILEHLEGKEQSSTEGGIIRSANFDAHSLALAKPILKQICNYSRLQTSSHRWSPPPLLVEKVNVNGAIGNYASASDVVARDEGNFLDCGSEILHQSNAIVAEAFAFLTGIHLALKAHFQSCIVEEDSLNVVQNLKGQTHFVPWCICSIIRHQIKSCEILLSRILLCSYVPREANNAAHSLAKIFQPFSYFWLGSTP